MKSVKPADLDRQSRLDPAVRLILLTGPDEATMHAVAARLVALAGPDAERPDLGPAQMAPDSARLSAEAASLSLFAGPRVGSEERRAGKACGSTCITRWARYT